MKREKHGRALKDWHSTGTGIRPGKVRIIGGHFRGRQLEYSGDPRTRPMKDSVREALFNLVGGWVNGKLAIDLFAGTGAIGLEALSRGAARVILIERHLPTAKLIQKNAESLGKNLPVTVETGDTFYWVRHFVKQQQPDPQLAWVVFCSPPYAMYENHRAEMIELIDSLMIAAPAESLIAVESDKRFDPQFLPSPSKWRVRHYDPAIISVWRNQPTDAELPPANTSDQDIL